MRPLSALAVLAGAAVLAGCGSPAVMIVDPDDLDQVGPRIDGECRILFRTGAATLADSFRMLHGTAIWQSGAPAREMRAPAAELAALQVRDRGTGVARGVGVGLLLGALVGAALEAANGEQNDFPFDESDRMVLSGVAGGVIGAVVGGVVGGGVGVWEDRYRFLPDAADPGSPTPPQGEPSPPDDPERP